MRYLVLVLIVLLLSVNISAVSAVEPQAKTYGEQLAEKNFANVFLDAVPAAMPGMGPTFPLWRLMEYPNREKGQALTYQQQLQLAGWIVPAGLANDSVLPADGHPVNILHMFLQYTAFVSKHGRAPRGAAEMIQESFSYASPEEAQKQFDVLMHGKPSDYPRYIFSYINPQTGKLYASFDGSVPEPGGLVFRKLEDPTEIEAALSERGMKRDSANSFFYSIVVHGRDPNEVLDTGIAIGHP